MSPAILNVQSVDFVRQGRVILDSVLLTVNRGDHCALIGANGAGKSTLLSMCGAAAPHRPRRRPLDGTCAPHGIVGRRIRLLDVYVCMELRKGL